MRTATLLASIVVVWLLAGIGNVFVPNGWRFTNLFGAVFLTIALVIAWAYTRSRKGNTSGT